MRSASDAREFLELARGAGDESVDRYPFPPELSGERVQLVMKIGRVQLVMWENKETGEKRFYKMHPAWKSHKVYENMPDYDER